ncbi:glycosyltransferase family 4 protein [Streptomyces sp. NPDC047880]|uniref:glycosyltransferase family 4 protein n=1 Tax=Streptomyces sp. NPDC047880 TaxID=3155626 RepID=UPI0034528A21
MLKAGQQARIVIVQPYVPSYRTGFFERLGSDLRTEGCTLDVLHGPPPPSHVARQDSSHCSGAIQVPVRRLGVPGGRSLVWQQVYRRAASADVVVLEQALRNLEAYPLLLRQQLARMTGGRTPRVALWGHGRTYTKPVSRVETAAKDALTRRASWFFAYTEGGADHLAAGGFPRRRITVVRNCVDTVALAEARERAGTPGTREFAEAAALRSRHGLLPGRTALFVGGLDAPKRIPLLLESAWRIAEALPGFRLLVAGDGTDRPLVEAAAAAPGSPVVPLGHMTGRQVALLGAVSDIMLMPGRVGLCAVDSFVLRTPVVTTDWPWHAPEFEYLRNGHNAVITSDDPVVYAAAAQALLTDRARLASLRARCREDAGSYTTGAMAARFREGLLRLLSETRRRGGHAAVRQ